MTQAVQTAPVVIFGAGPAGLTAAYELAKNGVRSLVLEQDGVVGGLARTVEHNGYRFDIGGHRFFTKLSYIEQIWKELLGSDLLVRPRLSRIYYRSRFFHYPLEPLNALLGLGPLEASLCFASFLRSRLSPTLPEADFKTWVSNRFGKRLFEIFFNSYTEKVWGMPCDQISAEWGKQRIRGMSLSTILRDALGGWLRGAETARSLARQFYYPRLGPGMMWSRMRERIEQQGAVVVLNAPVEEICYAPDRVTGVRAGGHLYAGEEFISSIPVQELICRLSPASPELRQVSGDFHYRDFITVALIVRGADLFSDNWLYIHDPNVMVGRIQNYGNWSPDMAPGASTSCLGLEYFCQHSDGLWCMSDAELTALAVHELKYLGLTPDVELLGSKVVRMPRAYPVYDGTYRRGITAVQQFLRTKPNLQLIGRNGMHRYNNQDHAMITGVLAARNIMGERHDLWDLEADSGYLEDRSTLPASELLALETTQPRVPARIFGGAASSTDNAFENPQSLRS